MLTWNVVHARFPRVTFDAFWTQCQFHRDWIKLWCKHYYLFRYSMKVKTAVWRWWSLTLLPLPSADVCRENNIWPNTIIRNRIMLIPELNWTIWTLHHMIVVTPRANITRCTWGKAPWTNVNMIHRNITKETTKSNNKSFVEWKWTEYTDISTCLGSELNKTGCSTRTSTMAHIIIPQTIWIDCVLTATLFTGDFPYLLVLRWPWFRPVVYHWVRAKVPGLILPRVLGWRRQSQSLSENWRSLQWCLEEIMMIMMTITLMVMAAMTLHGNGCNDEKDDASPWPVMMMMMTTTTISVIVIQITVTTRLLEICRFNHIDLEAALRSATDLLYYIIKFHLGK